jgi:TRAP transporter 4TM/12TM fusion protein
MNSQSITEWFKKDPIRIIVLLMFAYHFWIALAGQPEPLIVRPTHVGFVLFLGFMKYRANPKANQNRVPWYDWVAALLGVASTVYIQVDYERIVMRMPFLDPPMRLDWVFGIIAILLVLELTRRVVGKTLPVLVLIVIIYSIYGNYFPGVLNHPGVPSSNILEHLFLSTNGLFGSLASLSLAEIFMFIMFGAFIQAAGGEELFTKLATSLTRNTVGGPAKAAVIGSALFGTVCGSGAANVFATGCVTIPMMMKHGLRPEFAAAVEAVASSLGQLIPPVMGATAFLIAEFSQKLYSDVCLAAIVPSLLYVFAIFMAVHFEAKKAGLGIFRGNEDVPGGWYIIKNYGHILIPAIVLICFLALRKTAYYSATVSTLSIFVVSWMRKSTRMDMSKAFECIETGIWRVISIAATVLCAGLVVATLQTTGTPFKMTDIVIQFAGGQFIFALLLVAAVILFLGMGLPPVGCFLVASVFCASTLIKFGVDPFVTYMFIFMFGLTALITPPVCTSSYAAASIANCSFVKAGIEGVILGLPAFIIPFIVVYNPVLLNLFSQGIPFGILTISTALLGVFCLVSGISGMLIKRSNLAQRILLSGVALLLIVPGVITDLIGLVGASVVVTWQYLEIRAEKREALRS